MRKLNYLFTIVTCFVALIFVQCSDSEEIFEEEQVVASEAITKSFQAEDPNGFAIFPSSAPQMNEAVWVRFSSTKQNKNRAKRRMQNQIGISPIIFLEKEGDLNTYIFEFRYRFYQPAYAIFKQLFDNDRIYDVEHPEVFKIIHSEDVFSYSSEDWDRANREIEEIMGGEIAYSYDVVHGYSSTFTRDPFTMVGFLSIQTDQLVITKQDCCPDVDDYVDDEPDGDFDYDSENDKDFYFFRP